MRKRTTICLLAAVFASEPAFADESGRAAPIAVPLMPKGRPVTRFPAFPPVTVDGVRSQSSITPEMVQAMTVDAKIGLAQHYVRLCKELVFDFVRLEAVVLASAAPDLRNVVKRIEESAKSPVGPAQADSPDERYCAEGLSLFGPQGSALAGIIIVRADRPAAADKPD